MKKIRLALIQPKFEYDFPFKLTPLALGLLATISDELCDVDIIDTNFQKIKDYKKYDLVGISCNSCTTQDAYRLSKRFRDNGIKVIMGGAHPTIEHEEVKKHCDCVVVGEAEAIWKKVLEDFIKGRLKKKYEGGLVDMEKIPIIKLKYRQKPLFFNYKLLLIQTTRGCPYDCDFCSIKLLSGNKIRHRKIEDIVKEIKMNKAKYVCFTDDNFVADFDYAKKLLKALIPLNIKWVAQVPLNFAKDEALLKLAVKSRCRLLFVGMESINQDSLDEITNKCKVEDYEKLIKRLRHNNILIYASFIFGFDHDTKNVFKKTVDFCLKNSLDYVLFSPLVAFKGTKLYDNMKKEKRLVDNYRIKPKNMNYDELEKGVGWAYSNFFSYPNIIKRVLNIIKIRWHRPLFILQYIYSNLSMHNNAKKFN